MWHLFAILIEFVDLEELSPMIKGAAGANFYVETYESEDDVKRILENHLI